MTRRGLSAPNDRGFALVAALWVSVLLALAAGAVLELSRAEVRRAAVRTEAARLEAVADAAMNLTLARMTGPADRQPALDGSPVPVTVDGVHVVLRIEDETGKINLNLADRRLLRLLAVWAGLDPDAAGHIVAWRETGGFRSVGELRLVPGIDEASFRRLEPALTVWSQTDWIDPVFAGAVVLDVLRAIDPAARPPAGPARHLAAAGHAYTLRADVAGGRVMRVAVVRLTGQAARPFLVYRWD